MCPNIELQILSTCVTHDDNDDRTGSPSNGGDCWCIYVTGSSEEVFAKVYFPGDDLDPCIATAEACVLP